MAPDNLRARAGKLCGEMKQRPISNNLELEGIDNASLAWMAAVGGGVSYTKNNYRGLAEVFQAAASERFSWYQLVYNTQWFYHRRQFSTKLRLRNFAKAGATVEFYPSGWLDTPAGDDGDESMSVKRSSGWGATTLTMGWLGLLTFIFYLVPAGFNARRAVFRRRRNK